MGESWSFTQQGGGVGGGELSPGSGSSGFSSRALVFGNSSGQLVNSGAPQWDSTQSFLGIGTSAPSAPLEIGSSGGIRLTTSQTAGLMSPTGAAGIIFPAVTQVGIVAGAASTQIVRISSAGVAIRPAGQVAVPSAGLDVISTVNGNAFLVQGSTAGNVPVISVETTLGQAKLGFWTTAGSTRPSTYTTAGTTSRVFPATNTPVAVYSSDVGAQVNAIQAVVAAMHKDLTGYGLLR